jgi:hypothetical protein
MGVFSSAWRAVAGHLVAAFFADRDRVGLAVAAAATGRYADSTVRLALFGFVGGILGVGLAAFAVTAATADRPGVVDLAQRSLRWRGPVRWYLLAPFTVPRGRRSSRSPSTAWACWSPLRWLAAGDRLHWVLQDRWRDRYSLLRLSAYVAFWCALKSREA